MDRTRSFSEISFLIGVFPPLPPVYKSIGPATTVHLGTAILHVATALYGLLFCLFGVYFANRWTVSRVKNDPRYFKVQWTVGILRGFQAFFWLRVFPPPEANLTPPHRH
jgi:hypothetical protein